MQHFYLTRRDSDIDGTSNLSHLLNDRDKKAIDDFTPLEIERCFGPGIPVNLSEKGYTDPEWYFRGPGNTILGIGWRWGVTRLRGKNLNGHFITPQEIVETFMHFVDMCLEHNVEE